MKEQYNYFDEFVKDANYIVEAAKILDDTLTNFNEKTLDESIKRIHKIENDADHILHIMLNRLIKDFLPPLDREDIGIIIRTLDDIIDYIDELIKNFSIFNIKSIREDVLNFTKLLKNCSTYILEMFEELKNVKKKNIIKEKFLKISDIENQGDAEFERSMRELYKNEKDPVEIVKWTNIYKGLEEAIDECEHISDCVEDVVMKYA